MKPQLNTSSMRAVKARFAHQFLKRQAVRLLLYVLVVAAILLSTAGFVLNAPTAYLSLVVLGPVIMTLAWWKYDLKNLPAAKNPLMIDDVLDGKLLGSIEGLRSLTPQKLAESVMQQQGGQFYIARFGIGPSFLSQLLTTNEADIEKVWREAIRLQGTLAAQGISSAVVAAALIKTIPNSEQFLAHMQLSGTDIENGASWFDHIEKLIERHRSAKPKGGFGRDLSFGYTPLLSQFGINISRQIEQGGLLVREIEGHQSVIRQMQEAIGGGGRQNVGLVGPLGIGKTTLVHAFAAQLINPDGTLPHSLKYRQVIMLDPGAMISRARGRGELEELVDRLLYEAYSAKNIILCLDNAELFFEDGVGSVDLSNLLLPILEGGAIRMILTMDSQRLLQITQRNPGLARALNQINITEPDQADTLRVLQDQLIMLEFKNKVTFMYQSLLEAYRLGNRYVYEQAMPGKAMQLLEASVRYHQNGLVTANSVQQAIEQTMGVKVSVASSDNEKEKLLGLEDLIHTRMINQTRAVSVVSDALRRARAGVRNLDRPIGTFLFLGPTGVGKTELAKSIAEVYFDGEDRLVRLDLNEYGQPTDVSRLIADGATDPHSLSAQIAKQPFSVVLLDEIEKAHPDVLNTLLQMIDEGILRDIKGREVSFKDTIITATSNAGADKIRQHIDAGEQLEQFEAPFVNELINDHIFKPEFLNRFDDIVLFRPLTESELLQVVDLILKGVNANLALQKVSVEVDPAAKEALVKHGYDPRLGARPIRRVVQRTVENIVAKRMLGGQVAPGSVIQISLVDVQGILG